MVSRIRKSARRRGDRGIVAVDLFCGAGGLTHGLEDAGVQVREGVDLDGSCRFPYEANNLSRFRQASVADLDGEEIRAAFGDADFRLLAGCAPCQPFSTYSRGRRDEADARWNLVGEFGRLIARSDANLVTMENVPQLAREAVFGDFVGLLAGLGFRVSHGVVECVRYGVPQTRKRLVLVASKLGPVALVDGETRNDLTVRRAIGDMPPLTAGGRDSGDALHAACSLSPVNMERIRSSRPGGTWRDWPAGLVAACHAKDSGETYPAVYGRMAWDEPAPTVTTQYFGFGNGRFGHPEQDRAISLREGALLQSFPAGYAFVPDGTRAGFATVGRLIGNAVPPRLGRAIGATFREHVAAA